MEYATHWMREKLKPHIGHDIVCVFYGDKENPFDICIECETCNEVLVSAETFENEEDGDTNDKYGTTMHLGLSKSC